MELKAIQRSLPTAAQPPDPLARRQPAQYLEGVPIGLLPLFDTTHSVNSVTSPAIKAEPLSPPPELPPVPSRSPSIALQGLSTSQSNPLNGTTVPSISPFSPAPTTPTTPRRKPNFAFLPLLDSPAAAVQPQPQSQPEPEPPAPSEVDADDSDHESHPSTPSLSSASLDTTPSPREEDPDYGYFQLPTRIQKPNTHNPYFPTCEETETEQKRQHHVPALMTPSPISLYSPTPEFLPPPSPKKKRQESYDLDINGETYHFGPVSTPPDSPPPAPSRSLSPLSSPKYKPFFAFEQEREKGSVLPPSIAKKKPTSPQRTSTSTCSRDVYPPSPILAPYYVSMKRNGSPGSPVMS